MLCEASLLVQGRCGQSLLILQGARKRALPPFSSLRALLADIHGGFSTLDHELHLKLLSPSLSGLAAADWEVQMLSSSLSERGWHKAPHPELPLCCPFLGPAAVPGLTTRISNLPAEKNILGQPPGIMPDWRDIKNHTSSAVPSAQEGH